jgi:lysozyme family protein
MLDNWPKCCAITLDYEGGNDDDPHDPGGRTSRGITQREYDVWRRSRPGLPSDVWKAPQATVVAIYKASYWDVVDGDRWTYGCDLCVYDEAVNSGPGRALSGARSTYATPAANWPTMAAASTTLQDATGWIKRFQGKRLNFLHALRTWSYFGRGWGRRVAGIEALAIKMAAASRGQAPAAVLKTEATTARRKQTAAGGGATASAAATGAHTQVADWSTMLDIVVGAGLVLAGVAILLYLLHVSRVQSLRVHALSEAAK